MWHINIHRPRSNGKMLSPCNEIVICHSLGPQLHSGSEYSIYAINIDVGLNWKINITLNLAGESR